MAELSRRIPELLKLVRDREAYLCYNRELLEIFDGQLLKHVDQALQLQLNEAAWTQARTRIPPINVLRRVIKKMSKLYSKAPTRRVLEGDKDAPDVLNWYVQTMAVDQRMGLGNEYFNLFKNALIEPFLNADAEPRLRVIPSERFVPWSDRKDEDEIPTGYVFIEGAYDTKYDAKTKTARTLYLYKAVTADEYIYFDSDGNDVTLEYLTRAGADLTDPGVNPYGILPYVYINRDPNCLLPVQDSDSYAMAVLVPLLLTDINFAHMFQSFAIVYGVNVSDQGIKRSPNAFWSFKTEPGTEQKPEIGVIKPEADISAGLELVAAQLALWLNTLGIKQGAIGEVSATNFQSGIAKIVDEMDTSEARQEQIPFFKDAEENQLWDLVLNYMHPVWRDNPEFLMPTVLARPVKVSVDFAEQVPLIRRGQVVEDLAKELDAGLTTKERAIQTLNPSMSESEINDLVAEIRGLESEKDNSNGNQEEAQTEA